MFIFFVYKKDYKIPSSPGTSKGGVNVFARAMAFFNKAKQGTPRKDLSYFILLNIMFSLKLLNNRIVPDKTCDFQ